MAWHSWNSTCPKCDSEDMYIETDTATLEGSEECLECGHFAHSTRTESQMPLEEVNDLREERGLEPIKELSKQRG